MEEQAYETIRMWSREDLESFAVRAAVRLREHHRERDSNRIFIVTLAGFLAGAFVSAAGFLFGASLG